MESVRLSNRCYGQVPFTKRHCEGGTSLVCVGPPRQFLASLTTLPSGYLLTQALGPGDTHMSGIVSPGEANLGMKSTYGV